MIFKNELSLQDYVVVVKDIADSYFDENGNYTPHIGELYAICTYFNYCVEPEETDTIEHPITDLLNVESLMTDQYFMQQYNNAIEDCHGVMSLDFAHAYEQAEEIVRHNQDGMVYTGNIIAKLLKEYGEQLLTIVETLDIEKVSKTAETLTNGKISMESFIDAFQKTDRFNDIINDKEEGSKVVPMPKKESDG